MEFVAELRHRGIAFQKQLSFVPQNCDAAENLRCNKKNKAQIYFLWEVMHRHSNDFKTDI